MVSDSKRAQSVPEKHGALRNSPFPSVLQRARYTPFFGQQTSDSTKLNRLGVSGCASQRRFAQPLPNALRESAEAIRNILGPLADLQLSVGNPH